MEEAEVKEENEDAKGDEGIRKIINECSTSRQKVEKSDETTTKTH